MKSSLALTLLLLGGAAVAEPQVVADSACLRHAVDIEAFATCDRVVRAGDPRAADSGYLAEDGVPPSKRTALALYLDARQAYALKMARPDAVVLVDVRSGIEIELAGHPQLVDLSVPYREFAQPIAWDTESQAWTMTPNIRFATMLHERLQQRGASTDTVVLLLCRSGERSARAADELARLGYRNVVSIVDGFEGDVGADGRRSVNGWKVAGLPWTAWTDAALIARR
jgi:rhodanese-related sulfurtransferase